MDAEPDLLLAALDELVATGRENIASWMGIMERVDEIRELRRQGVDYADMPPPAGTPIIEAISASQERLGVAAARFRRVAVRELRAQGMSAAAIARAFGVSRQRVASLLTELND